jgi:hypothetical protein
VSEYRFMLRLEAQSDKFNVVILVLGVSLCARFCSEKARNLVLVTLCSSYWLLQYRGKGKNGVTLVL